jgi:hypothetical protein
MLENTKLNQPVVIVSMAIGAVALVCVVISSTGIRPFGEAEMLQQIEREDSQLCQKFGMQAETQKLLDCVSDLGDLRDRHLRLVGY